MHTQRLNLENWVKIDRTYASQQREKEILWETKKDLVFVTNDDPSTVLAKQEVLELLCDYLPGITVTLICCLNASYIFCFTLTIAVNVCFILQMYDVRCLTRTYPLFYYFLTR